MTTLEIKRFAAFLFIAAMGLALCGCIQTRAYVDSTLGDTNYADLKTSGHPQPIQLVFDFQNKAQSNTGAVRDIKPQIALLLSQSGLFSDVSNDPVPSGRKLTIVINRVRLADDAEKTKFGVGLATGGGRGMLTDGYTCTVSYIEPGRTPVTTVVKHALYRTMDYTAPGGLPPMSRGQAAEMVYRQLIAKSLAEIDRSSDLSQ